jgi:hypothetical protein
MGIGETDNLAITKNFIYYSKFCILIAELNSYMNGIRSFKNVVF